MIKCLGKDVTNEKQKKDINPDFVALEIIFKHYAHHFTCRQKKTWNLSTISTV